MNNAYGLRQSPTSSEPVDTPIRMPRGLSFEISKYQAVFNTRMSHCLAYTGEVLMRTLFLGSILYIFVRLWSTTYKGMGASVIEGFTMPQMIWYLVITEAITMSRSTFSGIDDDVKSGNITYSLNRPYHYLLYLFSDNMGDRLFRFVINLMVGAVITMVIAGPIGITLFGCMITVIAVILSQILDLLGSIIIGLFAFWIEDTKSISLIYSRFTMLLGGLLMPIDIFPPLMAYICKYLPFTSILYLPARTFVAGINDETLWLLLRECLWITLYAAAAAFVYKKGIRRVESNGG